MYILYLFILPYFPSFHTSFAMRNTADVLGDAMTATVSLTAGPSDKGSSGIRFPEVNQVKIEDTFWKPKLNLWQKVTVNDVFDKFEGKHLEHPGEFCNTFENFDRVAKGERNIGRHAGILL